MEFSLDHRTASLSVGEFADFSIGPRDASEGGAQGIWRAQLGTRWHQEFRAQALAEHAERTTRRPRPDRAPAGDPGPPPEFAAGPRFEVVVDGRVFHRGWTLTLTGRIDQIITNGGTLTLREIKTVMRPLPADESELRADYPGYFAQLSTYLALRRLADLTTPLRGELVFVETDSGLAQTLPCTAGDDALFQAQLERVVEFLNLRLRARERLRGLRFQPAFAVLRPGQESTQADLLAAFGAPPAGAAFSIAPPSPYAPDDAAADDFQPAHHAPAPPPPSAAADPSPSARAAPVILFEAPTGFGKTGALLEFALGRLRAGRFARALYLTSKSTGQLQVMQTLQRMTTPAHEEPSPAGGTSARPPLTAPAPVGVAAWHVRNKGEHCVNHTFHCVRDTCAYLADLEARWPTSGLSRFYLMENTPRDVESLRAAGRAARICPYEITRTALAFNDVWIGDYNYVFAPSNRGLFTGQPGFVAAETLLLVDEAHNLPSRVADAYSHEFTSSAAFAASQELHRLRPLASLMTAWDHWAHFLHHLPVCDALTLDQEDDARDLLKKVAELINTVPVDHAELGPEISATLWQIPGLTAELAATELPRLWWVPRAGTLALTCLDAAAAIGATLRGYGGVVLASATLDPLEAFTAACGLEDAPVPEPSRPSTPPDRLGGLNKRQTRKLYAQLTSGAELLKVEETIDAATPRIVRAPTPWRNGAYDIAYDVRVDTTYQRRAQHAATTAATIEALHAAAGATATGAAPPSRAVAVFFPSYAYAESIQRKLDELGSVLRVALQPRLHDLVAQSAWVEESLAFADALFLVLGSSFAEGIDLLGGRVTHAMVVGPALPEVNAVQRARLETFAPLGKEAAFRRVYQIPGIQKVNQALGRLVRAPGQRARVLLHCRRFIEPGYARLLAHDYQFGTNLVTDEDLSAWLGPKNPPA